MRKLVLLAALVAALATLAVVGAGWKWHLSYGAAPPAYEPSPDGWTWDPGTEG